MGKHFKLTCWKCGKEDYSTRVSAVFGCRYCRPAPKTEEYEKLAATAGHGEGNGNAKHQILLAEAKRRVEEEEQRAAAEVEAKLRRKQELANEKQAAADRRQERLDKQRAEVEKERARKKAFKTAFAPVMEKRPPAHDAGLMERILAEQAFTKKVDEAFAGLNLPPRCTCCRVMEKLVEAEDGRKFCPVCAYGTLRTGYCTFHATCHYPEYADMVEAIPLHMYPRELLGGRDPATFKPQEAEYVVDP